MIDPNEEAQIERALASLSAENTVERMPQDAATRFDAHLEKLMAEDANVIRSHRFGALKNVKKIGNASWLAAASILVVMVIVGFGGVGESEKNVVNIVTSAKPETESSPNASATDQPTPAPTSTANSESAIPDSPAQTSPGSIFGNSGDVESDLTQAIRATQSGSNYAGYLGPIAEKIQPLELPGNLTSLSSSHRACIKTLGISGMTIGVDSGTYKGTRITAYWITTGTYERGAVLVSDGCTTVKYVKE